MRSFHIYDFTYLGFQKIESKNQTGFIEFRLLVDEVTQKDSSTQLYDGEEEFVETEFHYNDNDANIVCIFVCCEF